MEPLDRPYTETTVTSGGYYHLTILLDSAVSVTDSDCPTQDCVHTGGISRAGQSIVCLPEQVVIQLTGGGGGPLTRCWDRRGGMKISTRQLALCAVLTALALGLSTLENLFPVTLVIPCRGVKLGLANIVTVFALYQLGPAPALAFWWPGACWAVSLPETPRPCCFFPCWAACCHAGDDGSARLPGLSVYGVSIGGAAAHNCGQMAAALITLGNTAVLGYLPFLLVVSLFTGALTGFVSALLLRAMSPYVKLSHGRSADNG